MPPTYEQRLRTEGIALAACGLCGSLALLVASDQATHHPASTAVQLAVVAFGLAVLGTRNVRAALRASRELTARQPGSGEPTPLWHLPLIVALLTVVAGVLGGWDAGLRVTAGCILVGAAQAVVWRHVVLLSERREGRSHYRVRGSRVLRGSRLGHLPPTDVRGDRAERAAARTTKATLANEPADSVASPMRRHPEPAASSPATRIALVTRAARATWGSGGRAWAK